MRALFALLFLLVPAAAGEPVAYVPPVDAPVSDPFRPPTTRYGPGNRGLEFDTAAGVPVGAAAPGEVTFAGPVAGFRYVTVLHADGVRTAYGPLGAVAVGVGDRVLPGERLGTTAGRVLWTARIGDAYVDPAVLLAASGHPQVRLVPAPGAAADGSSLRPSGQVSGCAAAWAFGTARWGAPGSDC